CARCAAAVVAAGTGAETGAGAEAEDRTGRASTDMGAGRVGASAGVGTGRVGADLPRRTKPPSPGPAVVEALVNERGVLPDRFGRTPQPLNSDERLGGRQGGVVGVTGGEVWAGRAGH